MSDIPPEAAEAAAQKIEQETNMARKGDSARGLSLARIRAAAPSIRQQEREAMVARIEGERAYPPDGEEPDTWIKAYNCAVPDAIGAIRGASDEPATNCVWRFSGVPAYREASSGEGS